MKSAHETLYSEHSDTSSRLTLPAYPCFTIQEPRTDTQPRRLRSSGEVSYMPGLHVLSPALPRAAAVCFSIFWFLVFLLVFFLRLLPTHHAHPSQQRDEAKGRRFSKGFTIRFTAPWPQLPPS